MKNYDLSRFVVAHQQNYETALDEIRNGKKTSHWMWYIFPQLTGLGRSSISQYYAISGLEEASAFLSDSYLGKNLNEICNALLELNINDAKEVFGKPDDRKLRSSMTLFACVSEEDSVFSKVLDKFFDGKCDDRTKRMLNKENGGCSCQMGIQNSHLTSCGAACVHEKVAIADFESPLYFDFEGKNNFMFPAVLWLPEEAPKMIVQIVHGMTEHIERYKELAEILTEAGIGVAGFDLRGHGKNAIGMPCASFGEGGWEMMLKEIHQFHGNLKKRFPNSKHFLLGFSLGSFLVREYFSVYGESDFSGAIIMGTGQQPRWILSIIMAIVKREIKKVGFDQTSDFIRKLSFGTYNKNFAPNRTNADWLCSDEEQLSLYLADDLCKEDISAGLFWQLLSSMKRTANPNTYQKWNKDMPVLLLSGSDDPVGDKGRGVALVEKSMKKGGLTNVIRKMYSGGRHDILHEKKLGIANLVCHEIKEWILAKD